MLRPFKRNQKDFRYRYENNPIQSSRLPKYEDRPLTNQGTICTGTRLKCRYLRHIRLIISDMPIAYTTNQMQAVSRTDYQIKAIRLIM